MANAAGLPKVPNNQWLIFVNKSLRMTPENWLIINNNNIFVTADGKKGKFDKFLYLLYGDKAEEVSYRIQEDFSKNLQLIISQDNG
jgi:hypothetical protein